MMGKVVKSFEEYADARRECTRDSVGAARKLSLTCHPGLVPGSPFTARENCVENVGRGCARE